MGREDGVKRLASCRNDGVKRTRRNGGGLDANLMCGLMWMEDYEVPL